MVGCVTPTFDVDDNMCQPEGTNNHNGIQWKSNGGNGYKCVRLKKVEVLYSPVSLVFVRWDKTILFFWARVT
jgi:hypothetical protein